MFGKKKKHKEYEEYEEDDGATIADMNIDGMPWYIRRRYNKGVEQDNPDSSQNLTKEQLRAYKFAALKAGLLIIGVFGVVYFLFIAFCDFVWFA